MKRLIDLFARDRFMFTPEGAEKLGLEQDDIFTVWVKYGGPESRRGILVRNSRTEQKIEVPGDLEVIPEKGNREGRIPTEEEAIEMIKNLAK